MNATTKPQPVAEKPKKTLPAIYRKAAEELANDGGFEISDYAWDLWCSFALGGDGKVCASRKQVVLGLLLLAEILETADA